MHPSPPDDAARRRAPSEAPASIPIGDPLETYDPVRSCPRGRLRADLDRTEVARGDDGPAEDGRESRGASGEGPGDLGAHPTAAGDRHGSVSLRTVGVADLAAEQTADAVDFPRSYRLRELIGRGGFGEVWDAVQEALCRSVAVKRLRLDATNDPDATPRDGGLERLFRHEALTAALLDHPNVLPVHDLGVDEQGRPLLAMKLVRGAQWNDQLRADRAALDPHDFLARHVAILADVARAVAYAHSRGIVHRDIKPAQIMLGEFGEVYLMDWGLAVVHDRALLAAHVPPEHLDEWPDLAAALSPAGTPALMAPEQTRREATDVGPWTDVYLLGGTLYHLLTAEYPHATNSEYVSFQMAVRGEVQPVRTPEGELPPPPELVDLAMTALNPDPALRVASARMFEGALRDYLTGSGRRRRATALVKGVATQCAGEETATYARLEEWARALDEAHDLAPDTAELATWRARVAERHARLALDHDDLLLARLQAEKLPHEAAARGPLLDDIARREDERRRAERRLAAAHEQLRAQHEQAEDLLNFLLGDLRERLEAIGRLDLLDAVGDRVLAYLDAATLADVGEDDAAIARRADALCHLGSVRFSQGRGEEAFRALEAAMRLTDHFEGRRDAPALLAVRSRVLDGFGSKCRARGLLDPALELFERRHALLAHLCALEPDQPRWRHDQALTHQSMADVHAVQGRLDDAERHNAAFRAMMEVLTSERADVPEWQRSLEASYADHAWILRARGRLDEAIARYRQAIEIAERLVRAHPHNVANRTILAFLHNKMGAALQDAGRLDAAIPAFRMACGLMEEQVRRDPQNAEWRRLLAIAHVRLGVCLARGGGEEEARGTLLGAVDELAPLVREAPDNVWNAAWLGRACLTLGELAMCAGQEAEARRWWESGDDVTAAIEVEGRRADSSHRATRARLLLALGSPEGEALARDLLALGYRDVEFDAACRRAGIAAGESGAEGEGGRG